MKDMPVFTTENGVASLTLREIPYKKLAYIKLQSSLEPEKLLEECVSFCRACGAERVCASGMDFLEQYPLHTAILEMQRSKEGLADSGNCLCLFPVTAETLECWKDHYNKRMAGIDNAAYMDSQMAREMLKKGDGYFVHKDHWILGLGRVSGDRVEAVASLRPGFGEGVLRTLAELVTSDTVTLQVASTNEKALRLYDRLGFVRTREVSRWYRVL